MTGPAMPSLMFIVSTPTDSLQNGSAEGKSGRLAPPLLHARFEVLPVENPTEHTSTKRKRAIE